MIDDMVLLREYATDQSERAFAMIVERYIGLVHSAALRQVDDESLAQEVTQAVFIILARKATSLGPDTILSVWLYRTARYAAADALKIQCRRQQREQEAYMRSTLIPNQADAWTQLSPLLDEAMAKLGDRDRAILLLRYFENKPTSEVAEALHLTEGAAHKCLSRALEKLRVIFAKRGITLTATVIAGAVSANSVQAAPAAMLKIITAVSVAKGTAASGSTLALVKGALKIMAWTKIQTAIAVSAAVILATGTTAVVVKKETALSATDLSWANNPKYWELDHGDPDPQKSVKTFASRMAIMEKRFASLPPVLISSSNPVPNECLDLSAAGTKLSAAGKVWAR